MGQSGDTVVHGAKSKVSLTLGVEMVPGIKERKPTEKGEFRTMELSLLE